MLASSNSACGFKAETAKNPQQNSIPNAANTEKPGFKNNSDTKQKRKSVVSDPNLPKKLAAYTYRKNKYAVYLISNQSDIEDDEKFIKLAQKLHDVEPETFLILIDDDSGLKQYLAYLKEVDRIGGGAPENIEFPKAWAEEHILANIGAEEEKGRCKWFLMEGYRFEKIAELR